MRQVLSRNTRSVWGRLASLLIAGLGLLGASVGPADRATGSLTVGGQTIPLSHVCAYRTADEPGDQEKITVLLTDAPLPEDPAPWRNVGRLVKEGKLRGLRLTFASDGQIQAVNLLLREGDVAMTGSSYKPEIEALDAHQIRARVYRDQAAKTGRTTIGAAGSARGEITLDVSFAASIRTPPRRETWTPPERDDESPEAVANCLAALRSGDPDVRREAALALRRMMRLPDEAVPALIEALRDPDAVVREAAVGSLSKLSERLKEAVPAVVAVLQSADVQARLAAAELLTRIEGVEPGTYVPALLEVLQDADTEARLQAAVLLTTIEGVDPGAIVPVLVETLRRPGGTSFRDATIALGRLGPKAREAVPALIESLGSTDHYRQAAAAEALGGIGPEAKDAVPALIAVLADLAAESASGVVAKPTPEGKPTAKVSKFQRVMMAQQDNHRQAAAEALGRIGPEASEAIPTLVEALRSSNALLREKAAKALEQMGPEGQAALQAAPATDE